MPSLIASSAMSVEYMMVLMILPRTAVLVTAPLLAWACHFGNEHLCPMGQPLGAVDGDVRCGDISQKERFHRFGQHFECFVAQLLDRPQVPLGRFPLGLSEGMLAILGVVADTLHHPGHQHEAHRFIDVHPDAFGQTAVLLDQVIAALTVIQYNRSTSWSRSITSWPGPRPRSSKAVMASRCIESTMRCILRTHFFCGSSTGSRGRA